MNPLQRIRKRRLFEMDTFPESIDPDLCDSFPDLNLTDLVFYVLPGGVRPLPACAVGYFSLSCDSERSEFVQIPDDTFIAR